MGCAVGRIPAGSGSAGEPKFNTQIEEAIKRCRVMIGILCAGCEHSHMTWGCPAEWRMVSGAASFAPTCRGTVASQPAPHTHAPRARIALVQGKEGGK